MKRIIGFLLIAACVACLAGCENPAEEQAKREQRAVSEAEQYAAAVNGINAAMESRVAEVDNY